MSQLALGLDGMGWLRLIAGLPFLLAPGIALADRWLPKDRARFVLAPVASISLLTLTAALQEFVLGIAPTAMATWVNCILLTALIGWPRLKRLPAASKNLLKTGIQIRRPSATLLLLVAIPLFVALVHGLQHIPGDPAESAADVYPTLVSRGIDGIKGDDYPYPLHVDEHIHFAFAGKMIRDRVIDINNPYTDAEPSKELFSVSGLRQERGFTLGLVQIHDLTGVPLATMFRFLPALWAGYLAITVWFALRPAPGALIGAAFVAVLPSTPRFLGVGYLISSPFALPWIFATLAVTLKSKGPPRFFGLMLLVTAAYFQHIVIGTLCIAIALLAMAVQTEARASDRLGIVIATLLPMLWILPAAWDDASSALKESLDLPFNQELFAVPGAAIYALAAGGTAWAFAKSNRANNSHKALALLAILLAGSLWWSISTDLHNDGTYSRIVFAFFLAIGCLASYGLANSVAWARERVSGRAWIAAGTTAILVAIVLAPPVQNHLEQPMYRVHSHSTWAAATTFEAHGTEADIFLSEPWAAPIYNAATGSNPHTVLYPGNPPPLAHEWSFYLSSGGANPEWLADRGITFIVNGPAPNAPHVALGDSVYRIIPSP